MTDTRNLCKLTLCCA